MGKKAKRVLHIITLLFVLICAGTLILIVFSDSNNPQKHYLSLTKNFHISAFDKRLVFFNNTDFVHEGTEYYT